MAGVDPLAQPRTAGRLSGDRGGEELATYLASRPDLLSIGECVGLGSLRRGEAAPSERIDRLVEGELGAEPAELFARFEPRPFEVSALFQWHRATHEDGARMIVKIATGPLRPGREATSRAIADLRQRAKGRESLARRIDEVAAASTRRWARKLDLGAELEALVELGDDELRPSGLAIPRVYRTLSSSRVLTLEHLAGKSIDDSEGPEGADGRQRQARRLCRVWLGQALAGGFYPLELDSRTVRLLPRGRVAFVGGPFGRLSRGTRDNLTEYLTATAAEEPRRVVEAMLRMPRELEACSPDLEERLEHAIRHVSPFRDGGWLTDGDGLAQLHLAQWRQLTELGLRLDEGVVEFFAAFFGLALAARALAPGRDVIVAGLQELRLREAGDHLRQALVGEGGRGLVEQQAAVLFELPQKLDRLLDSAGRQVAERRRAPLAGRGEPNRDRLALLAALLLALATTALLVGRFAGTPWAEGFGALAVLLLGGLFLLVAAA